MSNSDNDQMRDEYDFKSLGRPVRGKYAKRYKQGTNVVVIDPDLSTKFPNTESVNRALRKIINEENRDAT
jgi:hypothetical protein